MLVSIVTRVATVMQHQAAKRSVFTAADADKLLDYILAAFVPEWVRTHSLTSGITSSFSGPISNS